MTIHPRITESTMPDLDTFITEQNNQISTEVQRLSRYAIEVACQGNSDLAVKIMFERDMLEARLPEGWTFN